MKKKGSESMLNEKEVKKRIQYCDAKIRNLLNELCQLASSSSYSSKVMSEERNYYLAKYINMKEAYQDVLLPQINIDADILRMEENNDTCNQN